MNTRDLQYFASLYERRKFTIVAKIYEVSEPAISQAIKRLEDSFGVQLVIRDRVHHSIHITRAGTLLYHQAQSILNNIDVARQEVREADQEKIRFGLPPFLGTAYLPQITRQLSQHQLLNQLAISDAGSADQLSKIRAGELDIALIGSSNLILDHQLTVQHLGSRPFVIVVNAQSELAQLKRAHFADLAQFKFINLGDGFAHPSAFREFERHCNTYPKIIFHSPSVEWVKNMVRQNLGISFLCDAAVRDNDTSLQKIQLLDGLPVSFNISLVTRSNYLLTKNERLLYDIIANMKI